MEEKGPKQSPLPEWKGEGGGGGGGGGGCPPHFNSDRVTWMVESCFPKKGYMLVYWQGVIKPNANVFSQVSNYN